MELLRTKDELQSWVAHRSNRSRALVPTMGALHQGHASLIDAAVKLVGSGDVLTTIFVNPKQFGPNEDLASYPRRLEADLRLCEKHGSTAVFAPGADHMYEGNSTVSIHESDLSRRWCGASRPGHFDGVCTVVAKLFLLARPNTALFGEKDFQQLAVIQRLTRDLDFPVEIVGCPTVREADGLAMSSRNTYLSEEERAAAPILHQTLRNVANDIYRGNFPSPKAAREAIIERISSEKLARIDYVDVVDSDSLEPLDSFDNHLPRLLAAVFFGNIRLIDNVGVPAGIR